ncbi:MAG: SDR family oxidoreductase [Myxococcaceae bacterium]
MSTPPIGTRKVLVIGGGTGIGRAVAEALLVRGGAVVVNGRRREPLEELVSAHPDRAIALAGDITDAGFRDELVARARAERGGLDGVVVSAGVVEHQPLGHIDEQALRTQLEVNLVAALRIAEQALTDLDPGGAIVFVASTLAHRPVPTSAVYSASKAGMLAVMKTVALTGAPRRIRANAVVPGVVDTEMIRAVRRAPGEAPPTDAQLETLRRLHPLGRLGQPAEVADAVLHLLAAPWTTGTELVIDGGLMLRE